MQNLTVLFLVALFTACGTVSANRTDKAKQQVAEATSAWVAAYNSRDPSRITSCMRPKLCSGERQQRQSLQAQLRFLSISKTPANAQARGLLWASSKFGSTVMLLSTRATTRFLTSVTGNLWQTLLVTPLCI
jgi:hypothetical protein